MGSYIRTLFQSKMSLLNTFYLRNDRCSVSSRGLFRHRLSTLLIVEPDTGHRSRKPSRCAALSVKLRSPGNHAFQGKNLQDTTFFCSLNQWKSNLVLHYMDSLKEFPSLTLITLNTFWDASMKHRMCVCVIV